MTSRVCFNLEILTYFCFVYKGIETTLVYWPVKLRISGTVLFFRLQLWDCGESALRRFDHLSPVSTKKHSTNADTCCHTALVHLKKKNPLSFQSCQEQVDAVLFLFSFTDRTSFDDLPNQITKWTEKSGRNVVKLVVGTKYPFVNLTVVME